MKQKLFILLAGLLAVSTKTLGQQRIAGYEDKKTEKWDVRIYANDPNKVRVYTLKNGLTVITSNNSAQPRIQTMVAVKTGSKNDPADHTGLAHYLEHMLFKGTNLYGTLDWEKEQVFLQQIDNLYEDYNHTTDEAKRKLIYRAIDSVSQLAAKWSIANEYDKMCQAMGASGTNAFTSNEMTVYVNDIPTNMLHKWITLEAERYRAPVLRLFHTELEAVYEEKNISLDKDASKVNELLMEKLFPTHNYGLQTTIGTIEHLKNPSLKAIREYFNKYYVPNNMAIILCGDFDADAAVDGIAEHFAYMKPAAVPTYVSPIQMIHAAPQQYEVTGPDAEWVTIGYRMPGAGSREARVAKIIDLLLNNSTAGLIDLNLVKQQKVLSANSGADVLNDYGIFELTGKPREGQKLEEVRDLLISQMQLIIDGKFDENMLKAIILNEEISRIRSNKENVNRAYFLMEAFVQGRSYMDAYNDLWEMSRTRKEEIMEIAKEFLNMDRVEIFKRQGEPAITTKITKPEIHSVELNRDKQSKFVSDWLAEETAPIAPVFPDFDKQISKGKIGAAELFYAQNKNNRLFSLSWRIHAGKLNNLKIPLAVDYLKYLGTPSMSADSFSTLMYKLGCSFVPSSSDKTTYFSIFGPEENFDAALSAVKDLLENVQADEQVIQNLKEGILKKRADAKLSSRSISSALNNYAMYGKVNPSTYLLSESDLNSISGKELIAILHEMWNYKTEIAYIGIRPQGQLSETISKKFIVKEKFVDAPKAVEFIPLETTAPIVYYANYNQRQASIMWMKKGAMFDAAMEPTVDIFNQYFSGDMSSIVFQTIREAKSLAYSTAAGYSSAPEKGKAAKIYAFVGTQLDKYQEAIEEMNKLLNNLPVEETAFEFSKSALKNKIETERITEDDIIFYYWQMQELGLNEDSRKLLYEALPKLTMQEIQAFHKKYIAGNNYFYCIVSNQEALKPEDLKKFGTVKVLSLAEIFGY